jgi:hypothetical protein
MGMMMLGMLIMTLVGDRDSWNFSSLMMGGGMGGMGMMGGMGGGMGMMGGMMGGGMRSAPPRLLRSVPPTTLPFAQIQPGQTRSLPTRLVSLNGPNDASRVALPEKGEPLQIGDVSQLTNKSRIQAALRQLAAEKAPETVAQLVMWNVAAGLDWSAITQLAIGQGKWANAQELALAKAFVKRLDTKAEASPSNDSGRLYWEVSAEEGALQNLVNDLNGLLDNTLVLGLKVESGIPASADGPALACRVRLTRNGAQNGARVTVSSIDGTGAAWQEMGKFDLSLVKGKDGKLSAEQVADATAEGVLSRLVRAQLTKSGKVKGKDAFKVRIDNVSPLVLNGLALAGPAGAEAKEAKVVALAGLSIAPRRSLTVNATPELVERLSLKSGIRVVAADLSGL